MDGRHKAMTTGDAAREVEAFSQQALSMRAASRRPVNTRRNVHGQHAKQKACKNMQKRMAGRGAVEEISGPKEQHPRDKDADHVSTKP